MMAIEADTNISLADLSFIGSWMPSDYQNNLRCRKGSTRTKHKHSIDNIFF